MPGKEERTLSTINLSSEKFYLMSEPHSCSAFLKQALAPFNGPGPFYLPAYSGDNAQIITLVSQFSDSDACMLADGTSLYEQPSFKFNDGKTLIKITTFPHNGVSWNELTLQLTLHPHRDDSIGLHKILMIAYLPSLKDVIQTVEIDYFINSAPDH
jgi:hypothetical protein